MKVNPVDTFNEYLEMFNGMKPLHIIQYMLTVFVYLGRKIKRVFRAKSSGGGTPFHA